MSVRTLTDAHAELTELVGRRGPVVRGEVTRTIVERFATAAADTGGDGTAPELMLSSILEWGAGPPLAGLREDGTGVGREGWLPLDGLRLMGGGQDLALHAPVADGLAFEAEPALTSVTLKSGRGGDFLLLVITTEFRGPGGEPLVTCRETLIGR
jgi:hypothetical protein